MEKTCAYGSHGATAPLVVALVMRLTDWRYDEKSKNSTVVLFTT
jgi:hypothetical protein